MTLTLKCKGHKEKEGIAKIASSKKLRQTLKACNKATLPYVVPTNNTNVRIL